jgi:hypothetical protein
MSKRRAKMPDSKKLERWRHEFQQLHETLMNGREKFRTWYEKAELIAAETKTDEGLRPNEESIPNA